MRPLAGPHEITILVEVASFVSDWVQTKTGVRLQLHFLADYRNLLFFSLTLYLVLTMKDLVWQ